MTATRKAALSKQERLARQAEQRPVQEMTEAQFQAWIIVQAKAAGWVLQFHVLRGQVKGQWLTNTSTRGVPDLWLLRPSTQQLVVLEVKSHRGRPTPEQRQWIAALQLVPGVEAYVVSPMDARDVLDLLARPRPNPAYPVPATVPPTATDQGAPPP